MANQANVGSNKFGGVSKGTVVDERADQSGALVTTDGHARYTEVLYTGSTYVACNQAAVALTGLATTVTGFCLTNPVASGKNLVLIDACLALATAPAGVTTLGYAYNTSATAVTHTTPETVRNAFLAGNGTQTSVTKTGVGLVDNSSTTPTAGVAVRAIGGGNVATGGVSAPFIMDPIDGKIILSPGSYLHLFFLTTAVSVLTSMMWEEMPLTGGTTN